MEITEETMSLIELMNELTQPPIESEMKWTVVDFDNGPKLMLLRDETIRDRTNDACAVFVNPKGRFVLIIPTREGGLDAWLEALEELFEPERTNFAAFFKELKGEFHALIAEGKMELLY